ncbi:hypothetical protein IAR50_005129 [Cryptococcus sp. DSM 104548]
MCECHHLSPDIEKQPLCASCASAQCYPPTTSSSPQTLPTRRPTISRRRLYAILAVLVLVLAALAGGAYAIHHHISHRQDQDTTPSSAEPTASSMRTGSVTSTALEASESDHASGWNSGAGSSPNSGVWLAGLVGEDGQGKEATAGDILG